MDFEQKQRYSIDDLLHIMSILRSPEGCPWDKEQTHHSIRKNFLEETCEVLEAIDNGDSALLLEELGDVLLQIVFHAQMESEQGVFTFDDVADGICKKLIIRHPHIFADTIADTPGEVLKNWDDIKRREKGQTTRHESLLSVPRTLPSLMRAEKIQRRAAKVGFDYPDADRAFSDMQSEVKELRDEIASGTPARVEEELGDLLFAAVNVARFVHVDAEQALSKACDKFTRRFGEVEQLAARRNIDIETAGIDLLDTLWGEVKNKEL